ncbi:hypothetical protein KQX54_014719 [Cotesia glomerata]|uniref:BTB domain-containing protein n=1 Tax=Cotesia glomerata TaxID=32391 RepID=A0AAV7IYE4_COTGL|nr:hypothetical protein KQX54_014719 [Cotesia glomerata]
MAVDISDASTESSVEGNRKFLDKNELLERKDQLIPNNTLTIGIELTVFDSFTTIPNSLTALTSNNARMADDFKNLLDSKIGSDVVLSVKDQIFNAHRPILMARSPVFSTMFSLEMKERKEDRVSIMDIDPEISSKVCWSSSTLTSSPTWRRLLRTCWMWLTGTWWTL